MEAIYYPADSRGHANHGWLDSYHSFSFADFYDPERMGFSALRVINEDRVAPGAGFPTHGHRDMEIVSYVIDGALEHKDSMGNQSVIRAGEVQRMTAGSGVRHSEYNASSREPVHFLQIWILTQQAGLAPGYEQKAFAASEKQGQWCLLVSGYGEAGSLAINQQVRLYATLMEAGQPETFDLQEGRSAYIHLLKGAIQVNDSATLQRGDGLGIVSHGKISVQATEASEVLLFELPGISP